MKGHRTRLSCLLALIAGCGQGSAVDRPSDERGDAESGDVVVTAEVAVDDVAVDEIMVDAPAAPTDAALDAEADVAAASPMLFGRADLPLIAISLDEGARLLLNQIPDNPVGADVSISGVTVSGVSVSLGDPADSAFRDLSGKASFELRFDDQAVQGATRVLVSNMLDDPSLSRAALTATFFARRGVPTPRVSHALLQVNGQDFGIYAVIEDVRSPGYLLAAFGSDAGSLFEAGGAVDLWTFQVGDYSLRRGDEGHRSELMSLAERVQALDDALDQAAEGTGPPLDVRAELADVIDWPSFLDFAAASVFIAHRRGYQWGARDYALHRAPDAPRWRFVATRPQRSLGFVQSHWIGQGRLLKLCLRDLGCRAAFGAAILDAVEAAEREGFVVHVANVASVVRGLAAHDPMREVDLDAVTGSLDQITQFVASRAAWIRANMRCVDPASVDGDGDGASGCTSDCDDDDASIHPGAVERCNLRDDDCNGVIDDAEECPRCQEVDLFGAVHGLCFDPKSWQDARADCLQRGGELASITNLSRAIGLRDAAMELRWTSWWIGLNDIEEEGVFVWSDGTEVAFDAWAEGEPNNSNDEDCVHLSAWAAGAWNDLKCDRRLLYICRLHP